MQEKINELRKRKEKIEEGGGKEKNEERHKKGKLTARERILQLLDEGTFCEIDAFIEHRCSDFGMEKNKVPGEGVVTGYGKINGRQVCIYAQDFTVIGGSLGQMHAAKICKVQDMAIKLGCPCIGINDSGGARIQEGIDSLRGYGDIFYRNVQASGVIPQICVIMGPCAGGAVYSPALMDFIFMTDKSSNMFITGPQVVKAVTGEQVSAEELGGAFVHSKTSGVASLMFPDEVSTLEGVKKLLSYIPQNNLEDVPLENTDDDPNRADEELSNVLPDAPNKPYDIKEITPNSLKLEKQNKYQIHYYRRGEYENKKSEIKVVTGILCIGHEVRSFTDEANGKEYWVIDKSGKLIKSYQAVIGTEIMKYQPIKAILKVQDIGEQTDGFGAEYEGTYEVKEIISLSQP